MGKGTVVRKLLERHPDVWISVSATTRSPREGEIDGLDYFFVDDEEFDRMVADEELLEWAAVHGTRYRYGTPRKPVLEQLSTGVPVILEIDLAGARQIRETMPKATFVFLAPPSWEVLEQRLEGRGTEGDGERQRRLETAQEEMAAQGEFDAVVVNDDVDDAADEIGAILRGGAIH